MNKKRMAATVLAALFPPCGECRGGGCGRDRVQVVGDRLGSVARCDHADRIRELASGRV